MNVLAYFAYGSNMSTAQMAQRCPGAGRSRRGVLADHRWMCNQRGVATIVPAPGGCVHGVVWEVTPDHLAALDGYEGVAAGWYRRTIVGVTTSGDGARPLDAVAYVAADDAPGAPRPGYLGKVIGGALEHDLPSEYVEHLRLWAGGVPPR